MMMMMMMLIRLWKNIFWNTFGCPLSAGAQGYMPSASPLSHSASPDYLVGGICVHHDTHPSWCYIASILVPIALIVHRNNFRPGNIITTLSIFVINLKHSCFSSYIVPHRIALSVTNCVISLVFVHPSIKSNCAKCTGRQIWRYVSPYLKLLVWGTISVNYLLSMVGIFYWLLVHIYSIYVSSKSMIALVMLICMNLIGMLYLTANLMHFALLNYALFLQLVSWWYSGVTSSCGPRRKLSFLAPSHQSFTEIYGGLINVLY